jgi:hypothetical protein
MVTDNDNRIQFPATLIDFENVVGITGQTHDTYPAAGQQPRWDWMRSVIHGLLSMQSSHDAPTQYRIGTPWFDKTTNSIKVWSGSAWEPLSKFISIDDSNLYTQMVDIMSKTDSILPTATFSGSCSSATRRIKVPDTINTLLSSSYSQLRPLVYLNGLLIDPRNCSLSPSQPLYVIMTSNMMAGDRFTVVIQHFNGFVEESVNAF